MMKFVFVYSFVRSIENFTLNKLNISIYPNQEYIIRKYKKMNL